MFEYFPSHLARPILFLRRWLSDRMFERLMMSQVRRTIRQLDRARPAADRQAA